MTDSVLLHVKKLANIDRDCHDFDADIIIHINSVLAVLTQLGAGNRTITVEDESTTWSDIFGDNVDLSMIRSYVCLRVRKLFDPPTIGAVSQALNESIKELEYRIFAIVDTGQETGTNGN